MEQVVSSSAPTKTDFVALWKCTSGWMEIIFTNLTCQPCGWSARWGHENCCMHRRSVEVCFPFILLGLYADPAKEWRPSEQQGPGSYRRSALTDSPWRPWHLLRSSKNIDVDSRPWRSYWSKNQIEFRYVPDIPIFHFSSCYMIDSLPIYKEKNAYNL